MKIRLKIFKIAQCLHGLTRDCHVVAAALLALITLLTTVGCGTTKSFTATEQLLLSDAVDSTITKIDFRPLTNHKIYLDTKYSEAAGKPTQGGALDSKLVNADYVISAVRQQLLAAECMLVDKREDADLIVELRTGALGSDSHSVIYGLPATNIGSATGLIAGTPAIPAIPELALAKKDLRSAAAKVALFAYDRQTLEPYWQSGIAQAGSNARDSFFFGIGPFQSGTIYAAPRFAGKRLSNALWRRSSSTAKNNEPINGVDHRSEFVFQSAAEDIREQQVANQNANQPPQGQVSPYDHRVSSEATTAPVQR